MNHLRDLGIRFCLDDFGSGYSNLNSILRLPVSVIKMDRSLLKNVRSTELEDCFYRDVAHVLLNLGYQVLAEGVETKEEVELLTLFIGMGKKQYRSRECLYRFFYERKCYASTLFNRSSFWFSCSITDFCSSIWFS